MKLVALFALALAASGCRDDRNGTATTTSHVLEPEPLADDQSNAPTDLALVSEIRRRLVLDETLSIAGKSVIVVVRDGVVTLRGRVKSRAEHDAVVARVVSVPDVVRIDDRIETSEPKEQR